MRDRKRLRTFAQAKKRIDLLFFVACTSKPWRSSVPGVGLEPTCLAAHDFKSCV